MKRRPDGVTLISILHFIGAGFLCLGALAAILGMGALGMIAAGTHSRAGGAVLAGIGAGIGICLLILALLVAFVAWGLWTMKEWARVVAIVLAAIGALGALGSVMMMHLGPMILVPGMIRLAISAAIIWYLVQPHVQASFKQPAVIT